MQSVKNMIGVACLAAFAGTATAQNALVNAGFEDICGPAGEWTAYGNTSTINFYTITGTRAIKCFGPFNAPLGYSGIYQDRPAAEGQSITASVYATNPTWDPLSWNAETSSGTRAFLQVDFLDASGAFLNDAQQFISEKLSSPTNPDNGGPAAQLTVSGIIAPAGTATVRITATVEQGNYVGGAVWFDAASLSINGGANVLLNDSFETQAAGCLGSGFVGWVNFGNGGADFGVNPRTGNYAAKLFGGFNGDPAFSGWFQDVDATPGSIWKARGWARSADNDSLRDGNTVVVGVEFYDEFGNNLIGLQAPSAAVPTPGDGTYRLYESGVATAPEFTTKARFVILQRQVAFAGGATWWDDVELFPACPADFNGDGFVDFFDFDDFVSCFEGTACPGSTTADFNSDGFVDFFDFDDFVVAFETGC
jgi:hypothetical protein